MSAMGTVLLHPLSRQGGCDDQNEDADRKNMNETVREMWGLIHGMLRFMGVQTEGGVDGLCKESIQGVTFRNS